MALEHWELLSYIVTVFGLPLAIYVFLYEQRKERNNEDEAVYMQLSDNYQDFLRVALEHPDLQLFSLHQTPALSNEQRERMLIIFNMLVSLFELAYLLIWEPHMNAQQARRWSSWEDYMREWLQRADFRASLPLLLRGEDPAFVAMLMQLAQTAAEQPAERAA